MKIRLNNVSVHYGTVAAVKGVTLEVGAGETVSLLGANGAGKSTILKAVSGLIKITSGEIWFGEQRIDGSPSQDIVRMGVVQVPEGRRLFGHMSVHENLLMGAYLRKDPSEIVERMRQIFDHFPRLAERTNQLASSLSGGEQQMLAIARGLMAEPKVLILDEPTIGLAPVMVAEIAKVIADIGRGGMGVLLVEQNTKLAFKLSKRGYVLETGRVVLQGDTDSLQQDEHVKKAYLGG